MREMNGIIILDKPAGITSATAVNRVKRLLPGKRKIGHAGTLDSFATGVLLLLVGDSTKRCEELMGQRKVYRTTVKLGATTATDDPLSPEVGSASAEQPARAAVECALQRFIGSIQQRPPAFSALKVAGKRASDRVRAGEAIELTPRTVQIHRIELFRYEYPMLELEIECGRGTYIRSLARDLGEMLGTGGYLIELRRTRIGDFTIEDAVTIETLEREGVATNLRT